MRMSHQDNGSSITGQQPAFFNMRRRNKTPDMWGPHDLNSRIFSMRKSQDLFNRASNASHILNEEFANKTQTSMKRNLKTAGGVGLANLEDELLDKGIAYKASLENAPAIFSKNV